MHQFPLHCLLAKRPCPQVLSMAAHSLLASKQSSYQQESMCISIPQGSLPVAQFPQCCTGQSHRQFYHPIVSACKQHRPPLIQEEDKCIFQCPRTFCTKIAAQTSLSLNGFEPSVTSREEWCLYHRAILCQTDWEKT